MTSNNIINGILLHSHGLETKKFGAAFHNGLRIKPIKLVRVMLETSSCAKVQNIFVPCKFFIEKSPPQRAWDRMKAQQSHNKNDKALQVQRYKKIMLYANISKGISLSRPNI